MYCSENQLTSLDLSHNTALIDLKCYKNQLTSLDVRKNTVLDCLECYSNPLTSIQVNNKIYSSWLDPVTYTVKIAQGSSKIPFAALPQGFNKNGVQEKDIFGAQLETDGFRWDKKTNPITFQYQLSDNPQQIVRVELEVKIPEKVLAVKDLASKIPEGYVRLTFDAAKNATIDKKEKVAIDVLKGTNYEDTDLRAKIESIVPTSNDQSQIFDHWKDTKGPIPTDKTPVETKIYTAMYRKICRGSMSVAQQPIKLRYAVGDTLDLSGLVVTIKDNDNPSTNDVAFNASNALNAFKNFAAYGILNLRTTAGDELNPSGLAVTTKGNDGWSKNIAFKDFASYGITVTPANGTKLTAADNGKKITVTKKLSTGTLTAEIATLTVTEALTPFPIPVPAPTPDTNKPKIAPADTQNNVADNEADNATDASKVAPASAHARNTSLAASAQVIPQTGDGMNAALYALLMGLPGLSLIAAGLGKRRCVL